MTTPHRLLPRVRALDDLEPGTRVVVGCSGGADSLALLVLARELGFDVDAVYVDHGLRATSAFDASVVRDAAARVGARFHTVAVDVVLGANLEARARDARYDALERVRRDLGAAAILVGHTRDDQAETVLLQLLRGSGAAGLAGIPVRRGAVRRPLLGLRRADTRALCAALGLAPVHDPMNDDCHHRRVWLRREVIPQLEQGADRDLVEVLARQADLLRDDVEWLEQAAAEHLTDDAAEIAALPVALARRVVRQWLGSPPPSLATVERVLAVARGDVLATEIAGGDRVERVGGRLVRTRAGALPQLEPVELMLPGRARFGSVEIEAWVEHAPPVAWPDGRWRAVCDADLVPERAVIEAVGAVPASRQAITPVVAAGGPVWTVGYRVDRRVRVTSHTRRYLWLSAEPISP